VTVGRQRRSRGRGAPISGRVEDQSRTDEPIGADRVEPRPPDGGARRRSQPTRGRHRGRPVSHDRTVAAADRTRSKGERTRRAILDAAIARFGRDGFRATSVADIARAAGVGGTVAYAYFPSKEALFLAALDEDAAAVIDEGLAYVFAEVPVADWREGLLLVLVEAVDRHPLARRVLAGLEPDVTDRVADIPALTELRKICGQRLRDEQQAGTVRADIDPELVGSGLVTIVLSLLMSVVQLGTDTVAHFADAVVAVLEAAIAPPGETRDAGDPEAGRIVPA
jgi:AcrR family transcriptional regulator